MTTPQAEVLSEPSFAELFEQSQSTQGIKPGDLLTGVVTRVDNDFVVIDVGLKSEGPVPAEQFRNSEGELEVKVGDRVEVCLESVEDGMGETKLSREKARRAKTWEDLEKAFEEGAVVHGFLTGKVKGGFTVSIDGVRAFLPGSLVDVRPVRDVAYLEGKDLEMKIIKLDRKRNNVVVSRRAVVEQEQSAERGALLESIQEGAILEGVVKNLTDYGAFIDLGGIDGLLHITDMGWRRVKHPSEVVSAGDEVRVMVLKFDRERGRISLGMKQLGEDPWQDISRRYPEGTRIFGKVTNITDYGAFVEIEEGVEGLVHVSEIDWTNKNLNPAKALHLGQEVEVMVLDIDEERRRISLGIKQCLPNPWEEFAQNYQKGDRVSGQIKSITDFGVFIGLEGGIDGLIHLSDLSWDRPGEEAVRDFKKGDELEAVVLSIDPERERISLGIKQMETDPFIQFVVANDKGSLTEGEVISVDGKGAVIKLAEGVEGFLPAREYARGSAPEVGDRIDVAIASIDRKNRTLTLSTKAQAARESGHGGGHEDSAALTQQYARSAATGTTSLGDLIKEQLKRKQEEES
ncbi:MULTISPECIES: 30S ribosomal protein S1 [Acidithiobacillus]|jgi:small subunit ribosomal protein S1|uniref:30S ribosomal protein S1 n=3 Tax=Acidithiobacillus caldus TaxID=33059 RepID=F9ZNP2_ACICS|nr:MULTISPECIES: 30S ribosomal protein S1 [Acidithiobacillus]AEK58043.1 SSU ribosomal protein S1p [Acidithiobacillus caldus SM-1]AIA55030.1 SSU ribosomal protein S1p [Acidithiobacillus caldus ATCC 51756]AUW32700.1 30S ribosomal protein S1 [Acidithiobacillus caldus]MBU2729174.1 30S ribosomal protein S1 [Acidithiobacillus caldus]MBU2734171.1 30S ribosomal protein S1 [Acidithiobacillus caldus ATCC 51756]